ncbi:hypothetical protein ACQPZ2_44025 (plasmid) [Nocardia pseudovaccinii]|uniref:hypothetical protein n=1 Tax=Nocardia pseudovaccinii TaxID=189540 RepID=UPI003D8DD8A2
MTDYTGDGTALDQWLIAQRDALDADLATVLDLEAGLREVLIAAQYEVLDDDLGDVLDLESGLAAIVPEARPVPEARQGTKRTREPEEYSDDEIRAIKTLSIHDRWALRGHILRNGLELAYQTAKELADSGERCTTHTPHESADFWARWIVANHGRFDDLYEALKRGLDEGAFYIRGHLPIHRSPKEELLNHWSQRAIEAKQLTDQAHKWRNDVVHRRFADEAVVRGVANPPREAVVRGLSTLMLKIADAIHAVNDFTGDDLREAGLQKEDLDGLRWSAQTKWPPEWQEEIDRDSVPIGNGVFEVRQGNTRTSLV